MTPRSSLTVLFEPPFWIGLYERMEDGRYEVCRIVFGAQPRDCEVYQLVLKDWHRLRFSPALAAPDTEDRGISPKRRQRQISRQLEPGSTGTRAQQALQLQYQQVQQARRAGRRARMAELLPRRFPRRQEKKKRRHRGR